MLSREFFIDEVLSDFHALPKLGEESFARRFRREIGGGAAITACGLARLGLRVGVTGAVGQEDGSWVVDRLISCGVDTSNLERHPDEPTGLTVSVSTREDRAYFSYYGANQQLGGVLKQTRTRRLMSQARHVHFACTPDYSDLKLLAALRRKKTRISLDVGWHPSWLTDPRNIEILRAVDLFLPNEREGELVSGESEPHKVLKVLRDRRVRAVGLKLGGKGAALMWGKQEYVSDPHEVNNLDTTGAGDCFDGGFIYAWLQGEPPQKCLETANICGALSTRALGGIASFPTMKELNFELKSSKS